MLPPDPEVGNEVRSLLALRRKVTADEFRTQCEECKRLALDATPMDAGERARVERELRGKGNA
jgi:hypothetical protein